MARYSKCIVCRERDKQVYRSPGHYWIPIPSFPIDTVMIRWYSDIAVTFKLKIGTDPTFPREEDITCRHLILPTHFVLIFLDKDGHQIQNFIQWEIQILPTQLEKLET